MKRECGECSLCCKVMAVPEIDKPRDKWCSHARPGAGGCAIIGQPDRPANCGAFLCAWVERDDALPEDFRPDKVHAFFVGSVKGDGMVVHVDPAYPLAHKEGRLAKLIEKVVSRGVRVAVVCGNRRQAYLGKTLIDIEVKGEG